MNKSSIIKKIPIVIILAMVIFIFVKGGDITIEGLLNFAPKSLFLAFWVLMGMFALKSLSIMFPIAVLFVMSSRIYTIPAAILVNTAGLCVCFGLMYFIGYFTAESEMQRLRGKYEILHKLDRFQDRSPLFMSYIVRVISVFPMDVVSIVFGSMRMNFTKYMLGSVAGGAPMMIAVTLMGTSITDISSPMFIYSSAATALIIAVSFAAYYFLIIRKERR